MALYTAYAYSNIYSKAIVISPYVLESMDAILSDISQRYIQKNTSIYLSWGSNETSVMHEFVWQTKACTEIGNALSKKGRKGQRQKSEQRYFRQNGRYSHSV